MKRLLILMSIMLIAASCGAKDGDGEVSSSSAGLVTLEAGCGNTKCIK